MNVLLCLSHSIEEFDQLRLLHSLGAEVASLGGYIDPAHPHSDLRPALPAIPMVPEIKEAVDSLGTEDNLGAAQAELPEIVLDWADVLIYHHKLDRLFGQWDRVRRWFRSGSHRRVIWRSVGQSTDFNEWQAKPFRNDGLERVAYSPKEANIPGYSGHDALIRFYKDPADFAPWIGDDARVINFSQHNEIPHARDEWINWGFWEAATQGLPSAFYGPHSQLIGGEGAKPYAEMLEILSHARAYLYCGTQPASYTLGLIEAMMAGVPVVSIGPEWMRIFPYGPLLFEGHELVTTKYLTLFGGDYDPNRPEYVRLLLSHLLDDAYDARRLSEAQHDKALELFSRDKIAAQWAGYLGLPVREAAALVAA